MAPADDPKQTVLAAVSAVMKSVGVAGKVDANQVLYILDSQWEEMRRGNVVNLQPLHDLLESGQVPAQEIAQLCLVLERREDKLGVTFKLPAAVEGLPAPAREKLLEQVKQAAPPQPTAFAPAKKEPPPAASAKPAKPSAPANEGVLDAVRHTVKVGKGTIALLVVLVAAFYGLNKAMEPSVPEPMAINVAAVPNLVVIRDDVQGYAYDPDTDWKFPPEKMAQVASDIFSKAGPMGLKNVYFCGNKDRQCSRLLGVVMATGYAPFNR